MAKPIPTSEQQAAIDAAIIKQTSQKDAIQSAADAQDAIIIELQKIEDAYKARFDWYNDNVIGKYDMEKRALDGIYVLNPITESDIIAVGGGIPSGRLAPTPPTEDIVRIPEFDGGNTSTDILNEQQHIADQLSTETFIVDGVTFTGNIPITTITTTPITPSSTSVDITEAAGPQPIINPGDQIIIKNGSDQCAIQVINVIDNTIPPGAPPYNMTINFFFLISSSISSGATLDGNFTGTSNAQRTFPYSGPYAGLIQATVDSLIVLLNKRLDRLNTQISAISANEDSYGTTNNTTAINNCNISKSFIQGWIASPDMTGTGEITSLETERLVRSGQITTRLTQINTAYTDQPENYYDARYNVSNDRGNVSRGTLRSITNAQNVKTKSQAMVDSLQASVDSMSNF